MLPYCSTVTTPDEDIAGRSYARPYRVAGRADLHAFLIEAIESTGATVLHASTHTRAPFYFGVRTSDDERIGVLIYAFRCNSPPIKGRPVDEHRVQIRYGSEETWELQHPVGRDVAGVDVTLVVGVHLDEQLILGLDPLLYDPLPMGISVEFKQAHVDRAHDRGWHTWERENVPGRRRGSPRAIEGLETLTLFGPDRLLDFVRLERQAASLGLDPPLRLRAAEAAFSRTPEADVPHALEERFDLDSREILDIINRRLRLRVAVRGGVAEHHLHRYLRDHPDIAQVIPIDEDGEPDFEVVTTQELQLRIECKNCSPDAYADGTPKVEVQKTRASKGDPASRFYEVDHFDLVAACMFSLTGRWEFRFAWTQQLDRHDDWPGRVKAIQRIDERWEHDFPQLGGQVD